MKAAVVFALLILSWACSSPRSPGHGVFVPPPSTISAARSSFTVSSAGPLPADGLSAVTVTIVLRDAQGAPVSGSWASPYYASLAGSGSGNAAYVVEAPAGDGRLLGYFATLEPGEKTLHVSVYSDRGFRESLDTQATVTFAPPSFDLRLTSFVSEPPRARAGESVVLSWTLDGIAEHATLEPGGLDVTGTTSRTVVPFPASPSEPTERVAYTLRATSPASPSDRFEVRDVSVFEAGVVAFASGGRRFVASPANEPSITSYAPGDDARWTRRLEGPGGSYVRSLLPTAGGGLWAIGDTWSDTFVASSGETDAARLQRIGRQDVFLVRWESDGRLAVALRVGSPEARTAPGPATVLADGRLAVSTVDVMSERAWLRLYDVDGSLIATSEEGSVSALAASPDGSFWVAREHQVQRRDGRGTTELTLASDAPISAVAALPNGGCVTAGDGLAAFGQDGVRLWMKPWSTRGGLRGHPRITVLADASVLLVGSIQGVITLMPGEIEEQTVFGDAALFLARFSGRDGALRGVHVVGEGSAADLLDAFPLPDGSLWLAAARVQIVHGGVTLPPPANGLIVRVAPANLRMLEVPFAR